VTDASPPDRNDPTRQQFADALVRHELALPDDQIDRLDRYRRLLWQWNEQLNLTRHTDVEKFVARDVLDSVQLAALLAADEQVLDFGTGGGVPGIPLAILRPDVRVSLCESVGKKARVVKQIAEELELPTPVHAVRVEQLLADERFDVLVARAVGPLWKVLKWLAPHGSRFDRLLLVKGPNWVAERGEARHRGLLKPLQLRRGAVYRDPVTQAESVILSLSRAVQEK